MLDIAPREVIHATHFTDRCVNPVVVTISRITSYLSDGKVAAINGICRQRAKLRLVCFSPGGPVIRLLHQPSLRHCGSDRERCGAAFGMQLRSKLQSSHYAGLGLVECGEIAGVERYAQQ